MSLLPDAIYPSRIARARQIQGWMDELELLWLADQASKCHKIAEIGSWKGRSTVALAESTPGLVFAIDTWQGSPEHLPEDVGPDGWLFQEFRRNTRGLPVVSMEMSSVQAANLLYRSGIRDFDMVFIDGAHDYENVHMDISAWSGLVRPGGTLCGHDFDWCGVKQAVTEVLGEVRTPVMRIWAK